MQLTSIPRIRRSWQLPIISCCCRQPCGWLGRVHKIELISHIAKQLTIFRSPSAVPSARYGPLAIKMRKHKLSNTECDSPWLIFALAPICLGMCLLLFRGVGCGMKKCCLLQFSVFATTDDRPFREMGMCCVLSGAVPWLIALGFGTTWLHW